MAAVTASVACVAAVAPSCFLAEKTLSRSSVVLAAPKKLALNKSRIVMSAEKEHNMVAFSSVGLLIAAVVPEIAEAASPGVSPSLRNLLLSVVAGGVVLSGIGIAVAGVSTFDPVKRK
eukprot:jgi/Mesen1/4905/ME000244S04081